MAGCIYTAKTEKWRWSSPGRNHIARGAGLCRPVRHHTRSKWKKRGLIRSSRMDASTCATTARYGATTCGRNSGAPARLLVAGLSCIYAVENHEWTQRGKAATKVESG